MPNPTAPLAEQSHALFAYSAYAMHLQDLYRSCVPMQLLQEVRCQQIQKLQANSRDALVLLVLSHIFMPGRATY